MHDCVILVVLCHIRLFDRVSLSGSRSPLPRERQREGRCRPTRNAGRATPPPISRRRIRGILRLPASLTLTIRYMPASDPVLFSAARLLIAADISLWYCATPGLQILKRTSMKAWKGEEQNCTACLLVCFSSNMLTPSICARTAFFFR